MECCKKHAPLCSIFFFQKIQNPNLTVKKRQTKPIEEPALQTARSILRKAIKFTQHKEKPRTQHMLEKTKDMR